MIIFGQCTNIQVCANKEASRGSSPRCGRAEEGIWRERFKVLYVDEEVEIERLGGDNWHFSKRNELLDKVSDVLSAPEVWDRGVGALLRLVVVANVVACSDARDRRDVRFPDSHKRNVILYFFNYGEYVASTT